MADNVLGNLFGDIAEAIRTKTGDTETMKPNEFAANIADIEVVDYDEVDKRIDERIANNTDELKAYIEDRLDNIVLVDPQFTANLTTDEERVITVAEGNPVELNVTYSSVDNNGIDDGDGIGQVLVGGIVKRTFSVKQGNNQIADISKYLSDGSNSVSIQVTNSENTTRVLPYTITLKAVSLTSYFDASIVQTGAFEFSCTPNGDVDKTMHIEVDGEEIEIVSNNKVVETSGVEERYTIPAQEHGSHILRVWFTFDIDEQKGIQSNVLYYTFISTEKGNDTPIIAITSPPLSEVEQYSLVVTKFRVHTPNAEYSDITLEAGDEVKSLEGVGTTEQTWSYRPDIAVESDDGVVIVQTITCGNTSVSWELKVTKSTIDVKAVQGSVLHLSSYGRSNDEKIDERRVWNNQSGNDSVTLPEDFNFESGGWVLDEDDITVLRVTGGSLLTIPYEIFATDFSSTGKTIEIEFATRDVLDYDAIILSCFSNNIGLQLTAQKALFKSQKTEIFTQYKENEHIRLTFVVEKIAKHRLIYIYLNGIMCGVKQYATNDWFSHGTGTGITIGSNKCTIDLYNIRVYNTDLTRRNVLDNWIADTQNDADKRDRYDRNKVYNTRGSIVIDNLPTDLPYLVIEAPSLPDSTSGSKTVKGYYVDQENEDNSFEFEGAEASVQGTTSAGYVRKNYKIKFKKGFKMSSKGTTETGYKLRADSIATNVFTFKADVASSEGANNVELVRLYNEICPYKTPPQQKPNSKVRQGIDGFPIVIFHKNGEDVTFIGKYNFNHDKGTPEVFGFGDGDESWEIGNNTSNRVLFKSADFSEDSGWENDFEARYPKDKTNVSNLEKFVAWVASTDQSAKTDKTLTPTITYGGVEYTKDTAEYRLAKFKAELADYVDIDSTVFYYLFTEIFLMVDSRAKNAFPTKFGNNPFCWLPYDMDTAIGINNEGTLAFGYELEDGDNVYNAETSVLWINLRQAFGDKIKERYQKLRDGEELKLSYDIVEKMFEDHQKVWPEAIWNEDAYYKYLQPLIDDNNASYLGMLQGSKSEQRKWWLYNRFRYMDSKYNAGDALKDFITLRGYSKAHITVEPYADIYATIKYGSYLEQKRALRGNEYTLLCPLDNLKDTEIYIYSASQLRSIGDLSGLKVGYADFTYATKLTSLKLGDYSETYRNENLEELYIGNNTLLRTLDVRNCPNLNQSVDVSGCTNIEGIYFDGTSITGLELPDGGILKTLHLPGTITDLTILNQPNITDFDLPSYSNLSSLHLENYGSKIDPVAILMDMKKRSRVRTMGINKEFTEPTEFTAFIAKLDDMYGLDGISKAQVSGTISLEKTEITPGQKEVVEQAKEKYGLNITHGEIRKPVVTFEVYASDGTPMSTTTVEGDLNGGDVAYGAEDPTREDSEFESWEFTGWYPKPENVKDDMICVAQFKNNYPPARLLLMRGLGGTYVANDLVTAIGRFAFAYCENLTALVLPRDTMCALANTNAFEGTPIGNGTGAIYVPKKWVESYKNDKVWSKFKEQIQVIEEHPEITGG